MNNQYQLFIILQYRMQTTNTQTNNFQIFRQFNTFLLFITAICNSMIVQALSTINNEVVQYLPSVSSKQVSVCALLFMIIHPIMSIPSNYILDNYSLKIGISIDCIMVLIGVCLRMLILESFTWVLIGNALVALGNAFVLYCPAKYSALWYPVENRLLVTGLIVFANTVSGGVGAFISPFFVKSDLSIEEGRNALRFLMIVQGLIVGSVMVINLLVFKGEPQRVNSSIFSKIKDKRTSEPYKQTLKSLISDKQFIFIFFSIFLSLSALNSLLTNVELIISPFGFTSKDAGLSAIIVLPAALISSIITSHIIKKILQYKKVIIVETLGTIIALLIIYLGLYTGVYIIYWIGIISLGIFGFPMLPTIIQYACETLYPVGQATLSGLIIAGGQLMSFLTGIIQASLLESKTKQSVFYVVGMDIVSFLITLTLISLTRETLKRRKSQNKSQIVASLFSEGSESEGSDT